MANKITTYDVWVGNLPLNADDKNVGKVFSKFGETASIFTKIGKTGEYKYAFIKYFSEADANKAVAEIDGKEVDGKIVIVKRDVKQLPAEEREKSRNKRNLPKAMKKPDLVPEMSQNRLHSDEPRKEKERDSVIISHVENPVVVWIQEVTDENTEKLLDLSEQLASLCPAAPKLSGPVQSGKVYAALFSEDQQWYRCRLKQSLGSDTIKVLYIDYGNSEEVKTDSLVEIPPSLGSIKQMANKLVLHNCYAHDLSDQNGIEFLRKLTDGQVIDAQKTIPLKDNSGHYGNLFMGDICLNEQVKEQGYAYMRPAMSSNTLKSEEKSGAAIFGPKRNTGSPMSQSFGTDQIIGSGGGYADSGGGGELRASPLFSGASPAFGGAGPAFSGAGPAFSGAGPAFGGRKNDGKMPNKFQSYIGGSPDAEIEQLKQEVAKKNLQLQQVLNQTSDVEMLRKELTMKNMQLQQFLASKNDGKQEAAKLLQTKLTKKQRELEKTKAELGKTTLLLQQSQAKQFDISQVTELCEQVRNIRCQFPTGQKSGLEGAINIALSSDKILSTSLTTLQAVVSVMTRYRLIQKEISSCTDKVEVENLIKTRDDAREELYDLTNTCLEELNTLPIEKRFSEIQEVENQLQRDYEPFLAFNVHNNLSLEDLVPGFNDWRVKREAEFKQIRSLTSSFESTVEQNILHLLKMLKLDPTSSKTPPAMPFEELLTRYAQLLQQEIIRTDLEQTGDVSLIAAIVKAIMNELSIEMNHINHFIKLKTEFTDTNEGIHPWLHTKPNTEELVQIKKAIRGLKSKLRHKEADRQDLVEAGDSADELEEVKSDIEQLKSDLHKALLSQETYLLSLAKATSDHFPELFCQFEDLGIKSLLLYNGLVTPGRELDHYTLSHLWKEGLSSSKFAGEPVYLQEYLVGDTDHLDRESFIKNVARFKEVSCKCPQLPNIQSVFFSKNDRLGYVQMDFPEVICLQEVVKSQLDIKLRQKIIENITKALHCLHEGHIVHGEINPCNIGYTPDGEVILLCPDISKTLEDRLKKPFVADNGISFRCPEVACGRSAGTKSTDIYCLGLVILWLYFPSLSIPVKADGYPRLSELQMDPQISALLYNILCHPDSRFRATQVLESEYVKANLSVPSSNVSDSSTEDTFSTSNSVCSVIDNYGENSLPPCQDIPVIDSNTLSSDTFQSVNDVPNTDVLPPIENSFPVVSQFNPSDVCVNQDTTTKEAFVSHADTSMEMLANCLMKLPPLSELPGLPDSDQDISESYQSLDGMKEEVEDEKTEGNITPLTEDAD